MDIKQLNSTESPSINKAPLKQNKVELMPEDKLTLSRPSSGEKFFSELSLLRSQAAKSAPAAEAVQSEFKSGFVHDYIDGRQVDMKMQELAKKHPDFVTLYTRDYKTEGYDGKKKELQGPSPLRYMRICNKKDKDNDSKTGVLLIAAPHAREAMQPMVMMETAQQLLENYNPDSKDAEVQETTKLMDNLDIYIVGVSNPDGLNFALYDDPMWRKTRASIPGSEEKGVDCNRNYDYNWLPSEPEEETYSGEYPFSEPETRNIASVEMDHPNIQFIVDFHSRGEQVRRPIGIRNRADLKRYKKYQQRMQDAIAKRRGKKYDLIESKVVHGSSDDYFYFKKGKFAFVVENGTEFMPEREEAVQVVMENVEGAKEVMRMAYDYGREKKA